MLPKEMLPKDLSPKSTVQGASLDLRALMGQVTGRKRHILVDTLACCLFRPLFF
jgi:hypothetical protein